MRRFSVFTALACVALFSLLLSPANAQRTPDGQPDLQGIWTNATITPFERPAAMAGKATLTEEEAAALERQAAKNRANPQPLREGDVGTDTWLELGTKVVSTRQTSLVVDPPDGRIQLTPEAERIHAFQLAHNADSYEYMSLWDRCITRGMPGGMFPGGSDNAYQIIQTPGYVVIAYEMIHEAHIIPLTDKHLSAKARQLNGDSIGHWEGNTLVVDTTNYNGHGQIATSAATGRLKAMPETENLHVIERFTRVDAGTINYEVTVDDPPMYSKPWKVSIPLMKDDSYRIFEYACHEGNQATVLELNAGRVQDAAKAKAEH
jgi:hypothetical protein